MALTVFALRHLLVLAAIAATAWAAGTLASGALRRGASSVPWPFRIAIGLALLSQAALLLGLAGWLRAPIVAAAALGVSVVALVRQRRQAAGTIAGATIAEVRRTLLWSSVIATATGEASRAVAFCRGQTGASTEALR